MREREIFIEALQCMAGAEREAYLVATCAGDEALRQRVENLLREHFKEESFFLDQLPCKLEDTLAEPMVEKPGMQVGPYKLLQQIGEGGFGVVFMAEQTQPVQRKVALKVIKPGMDTRQVIARFEAERQALAVMDHPNIARVLEAGPTVSGRPYFVMELVRGLPITTYCDENNLSVRERLELFATVCQAIQHAHTKGIIHRDIKPSNVLVTRQDGRAMVKVIDFGVAKAIGQQLTERTLFTAYAQMIGTPLYMSPEQAELSSLDIDTRSDIYSLGVLLYELLTGSTPVDKEALRRAAFDEIRRIIREDEPPKPSIRISGCQTIPAVAAHRHIEPARLTKLVRGELDWIVMKALEKNRDRRYETANAFAADVHRYLNNETVQASPPSALYRFRKLMHRHQGALAIGGLIFLGLLLATTGLALSNVLIRAERNAKEKARRESVANERKAVEEAARAAEQHALANRNHERAEGNFRLARAAVDQMLTRVAEDMAGRPQMEQVRRALLLDALKFYEGFLQQKGAEPSVRHEAARAYQRVGDIHMLLGQLEQANAALLAAVELLGKLSAEFPTESAYRSELVVTHNLLAVLFSGPALHRPQDALEHALAGLADLDRLTAAAPNDATLRRRRAEQLLVVGVAYGHLPNEADRAMRYVRGALPALEEIQKSFPTDRSAIISASRAHHWQGWLNKNAGRWTEAEANFRRELAVREALPTDRPEDFFDSMTKAYLAEILLNTARPETAQPLLVEVIAYREKVLSGFPADYSAIRRLSFEYELMGRCQDQLGRPEQAIQAFRQSIVMATKVSNEFTTPEGSYSLAWRQYNFALLLHDLGHTAEAVERFQQAQVLFEENVKKYPELPARVNALAWFLADCPAVELRDPPRAVELAKRALRAAPESIRIWSALGIAQARSGAWREANESLQKATDLSSGQASQDWFFRAMAQWHLGNKPQARVWYDQAVRWMDESHTKDEEARRFRGEAEALTGFKKDLGSSTK